MSPGTARLLPLARQVRRAALPLLRRLPAGAELALRRLGAPLCRKILAARPGEGGPPPPFAAAAPPATPSGVPRTRPPRLGRGPAVILMYHRVADEAHDPFRLAVHPRRFAAQLAQLARLAEPVHLPELLRPARAPRVAVTLDDGYADNLSSGLAPLGAAGVPATLFVTSGLLGSTQPLWPLRLEALFREAAELPAPLRLELGGRGLQLATGTPEERLQAMHRVHEELRPRRPGEIAAVLEQLGALAGHPPPDPARRMLTAGELQELAASPLLTIGAHTRRHPWLATLRAAELEEEVAGSRRDLEELLGRPVLQLAYPFGARASFDGRAVRAARLAGFALACTTFPDPQVAGTSRFRLPRRQVLDWEAERFAAELAAWLAA